MLDQARRMMPGVFGTLRVWQASLRNAVLTNWSRVPPAERIRLRNHGLAAAAATAATLMSLAAVPQAVGPLILLDFAVAAVAWLGGLSAGATAALTATLVARIYSLPIAGTPFTLVLSLLVLGKWLVVAAAGAAVAEGFREDNRQIAALDDRIQNLEREGRQAHRALMEMEASSASAHALLRDDADLARQQLANLQSVTDPALNAFNGGELVSALLDRLRVAVDADGVAIYHHHGLRGRLFSGTSGVAPTANVIRRQLATGYQTGRTTLIHNDSERVAETSFCQWPADIASLILVPVVYSGRLQLVVEVASRRARRSTEWELALIQVVAERAAGLLRPDANFDTGAVA